jgi:hypothetical protein
VRRESEEFGGAESLAGAGAPPVVVDVCRCGCSGGHPEPEWALATAWAWLTRQVEDAPAPVAEPLAEQVPWWDARASRERRRAVLPLVLLGELQAGVLLRAVWEVVQTPGGPTA